MIWRNNDIYLGKVGNGLQKDGYGVLYVKGAVKNKGINGDKSSRGIGDGSMVSVCLRKSY